MQTNVFGHLSSGEAVTAFRLEAPSGAYVQAITLGGIVTRLGMPDRRGTVDDLVLGLPTLADYERGHPFFGAIVGRVAGRIPGGRISTDGKDYRLALNDGPNHLHGGWKGLDKRLWQGRPLVRSDGADSVGFTYSSPDGEEGYPGTVILEVVYTLTSDHVFIIESTAQASRPTPVSLTHHSYFNLAGEGSGDILDHRLTIHARQTHCVDESMTPLNRLEPVTGTPRDFRAGQRIGPAINDLFRQHGDLYQLDENGSGDLRRVARLEHQESGRVLDVSTNEACLQFYTGELFDGSIIGKSGRAYNRFAGLCLECQGFPGGSTHPEFGSILVNPDSPGPKITQYAFSAI